MGVGRGKEKENVRECVERANGKGKGELGIEGRDQICREGRA